MRYVVELRSSLPRAPPMGALSLPFDIQVNDAADAMDTDGALFLPDAQANDDDDG